MKLRPMVSALLAAGILGAAFATAARDDDQGAVWLSDCCTPADEDFPKVGGNLGNQNYTALRGINKGNIRRLGAVWTNNIEGGLRDGTNQSSPVVVDGVIYIESALGNVIAVDGVTGATRWKWTTPYGTVTRRGVAVAKDLGIVYTLAGGNRLVALNKETGVPLWEKIYTGVGNVEKVGLVYHDGMLYIGTNDNSTGAALHVNARNGEIVAAFYGTPRPGDFGYDTWGGGPVGGASAWMLPSIDPELNSVYWIFGNARGGSSQNGSARPGDNLFADSIVAVDLKTGAYKWHYQTIHHDVWDMDNILSVLAEVRVHGKERKVIVVTGKTGQNYILDRKTGEPLLGIDEKPVPQDPRQAPSPTQPFARQGPWTEQCIVDQPLGSEIPGDPNRAVPNYPQSCIFQAFWDIPVLAAPGHGGGAGWAALSFSPRTGYMYAGQAYNASAHSLTESANGLRPPGQYQTGAIVAVDVASNRVAWKKKRPYELAKGNGVLTTASDLLFIGEPDGNVLSLDARDGRELWHFQTDAAISASPAMYKVNGETYLVVYAGGTSIPYGNSAPRGDTLWAFKIGGTLPQAAAPTPPVVRRPVSGNPVEGAQLPVINPAHPANTVLLGRSRNGTTGAIGTEGTGVANMAPTHMRVPAGTTVTFSNPANNVNVHCATQFFEGLFNPRLNPGESFSYTFQQAGEYFFNDCFSPRPTGKIEVY